MEKIENYSSEFKDLILAEDLSYDDSIDYETFEEIITKVMTNIKEIGRYYSLVHTHSKVNPILRNKKYEQGMEYKQGEDIYTIDFSNKITDFADVQKNEFMRENNQLAIRIYKNLSDEGTYNSYLQSYDKKMTCIYDIDMNEICELVDFDSKKTKNKTLKRSV